jgi:methyl-accepting chemotaxis protein
MALGTAKKLQKVINAAEELYGKMNEVIGRLTDLEAEVERTSAQVDHIEYDLAEQRAVLEAIADAEGLDVDEILESTDLPAEPEPVSTDDADDESGAAA